MNKKGIKELPFGKMIEENLKESLRMAGLALKTSADLDHNRKIDFVLNLNNQRFGIQFSLRNDRLKAKVAAICALDEVPRFIYLSMAKEYFEWPSKRNGKDLYLLLSLVAERHLQEALYVHIDHQGMKVKAL